jgi:hypothetical protein
VGVRESRPEANDCSVFLASMTCPSGNVGWTIPSGSSIVVGIDGGGSFRRSPSKDCDVFLLSITSPIGKVGESS